MTGTLARDISQLNTFLRGELSAVETYDQALHRLNGDAAVVAALRAARDSHQQRAETLRRAIEQLGGVPSAIYGLWGSFAKLVEGTSGSFAEAAAIAALERGESYGRDDYEHRAEDLSPWLRSFIESQLVPEQRRSLQSVTDLRKRLSNVAEGA